MINLVDLRNNYNPDTITCFERPLAIIMKYYNNSLENLILMVIKLDGIYTSNLPIKNQIIKDMEEIFGCNIVYQKYSPKEIFELNEKNIPVVCGINLYDIFLSANYKKQTWPHWTIIYQVEYQTKIMKLFDNFQFSDMAHTYDKVKLTYKMIKLANKSYNKYYGKKYNCFYIDGVNLYKKEYIMKNIIEKYINIDEKDIYQYKQIHILQNINKIRTLKENIPTSYIDEFKKKVININKYRIAFFEMLILEMNNYNYEVDKITTFQNKVYSLKDKWHSFVMIEIVKSINTQNYETTIPKQILALECEAKEEVRRFYDWFSNMDFQTFADKKNYNFVSENNSDRIIIRNSGDYIFEFSGEQTYNWWKDYDYAPKVILKNKDLLKNNIIKFNIYINENFTTGNFQAGIFIRSRNKNITYMVGIENNSDIILDIVGVTGFKQKINRKNSYNMYCKISNQTIYTGLIDENRERELIAMDYEISDIVEVGLACKTWEKGGDLKVIFSNICI